MANIEKIRVGETDYNIRVPDGSSLSLSSLTVTGNLTVSGTANLSVVKYTPLSIPLSSNTTFSQLYNIYRDLNTASAYKNIILKMGTASALYSEGKIYPTLSTFYSDFLSGSIPLNMLITCDIRNQTTTLSGTATYYNFMGTQGKTSRVKITLKRPNSYNWSQFNTLSESQFKNEFIDNLEILLREYMNSAGGSINPNEVTFDFLDDSGTSTINHVQKIEDNVITLYRDNTINGTWVLPPLTLSGLLDYTYSKNFSYLNVASMITSIDSDTSYFNMNFNNLSIKTTGNLTLSTASNKKINLSTNTLNLSLTNITKDGYTYSLPTESGTLLVGSVATTAEVKSALGIA